MSDTVDIVVSTLERWPLVRLSTGETPDAVEVRVGPAVIASVDRRRDRVLVKAPQDTWPTLRRLFPSAGAHHEGLVFDLDDGEGVSSALAALRRRATVQFLAWQSRVNSP